MIVPSRRLVGGSAINGNLVERTLVAADGSILPSSQGLALHDAMLVWGDPDIVAEFRHHEDIGPRFTFNSVFNNETPADRLRLPYTRLYDQLSAALIERLCNGELIATAFDEGMPADAAPISIRPERWRVLIPDFKTSSATGTGLHLTCVRVHVATSMQNIGEISTLPAPTHHSRLVLTIHRAAREVSIGPNRTSLSIRSFKLLNLLVTAALDRRRVVSRQEIEQSLWSSNVDKKACADAVRALRGRIAGLLPKGLRPDQVIANRPPGGYILDLSPEDVLLGPE